MSKLFKEKLLTVSTKKIQEIEAVINQSSSSLKKLILPQNLFSFSFFLIIINTIVAVAVQTQLPQEIPLFYSRPWGNEQLVKKIFLILLPLFSLFIAILNFLLAKFFQKKGDYFIPNLCAFFSLLFSLMATVPLVKIILLVI